VKFFSILSPAEQKGATVNSISCDPLYRLCGYPVKLSLLHSPSDFFFIRLPNILRNEFEGSVPIYFPVRQRHLETLQSYPSQKRNRHLQTAGKEKGSAWKQIWLVWAWPVAILAVQVSVEDSRSGDMRFVSHNMVPSSFRPQLPAENIQYAVRYSRLRPRSLKK